MNFRKIEPYVFAAVLVLAVAIILIIKQTPNVNYIIQDATQENLQLRFSILSKANTNLCAAPSAIYNLNTDYLQGSCCSPMDFNNYKEQIEELKKYSYLDIIPKDPYNVSFSLAERLLNYDKDITLNSEQQKVYNDAMNMSKEKGPCCCKCWRWYAFEGQAKYLITEKDFTASQIAEIWGMEDGCGGSD